MSLEAQMSELQRFRNEPLDPELVPYVYAGPLGPMLKHPLVFDLMVEALPGHANRTLRYKRARIADAIAARDWDTYVWLHERPYRVEAVRDLMDQHGLTWDDVTALLPNVWTDSENIPECLGFWREAFAATDGHLWMRDDELAEFRALPERLTVYRGECNDGNVSWTRDPKIAKFFANRSVNESTGVVSKGRVHKRHVFAYLTRRGESEIIVTNRSYVK